jgi:hypothetical protein
MSESSNGSATYLLGILQAAGYAVVQLPEPVIDQYDTSYYEFSDGGEVGSAGAHRGSGVVYSNGREWTPKQARVVAANWLAAADAAEDDELSARKWHLRCSQTIDGIVCVTFEIDLDPPEKDVKAAMRKLAAAALWWVDQYPVEGFGDRA